MATTYWGLTSWQWLVVAIAALMQAATAGSGGGVFAAALVGGAIGSYIFVRIAAMISRGIRGAVGRRLASDS